MTGVRCVWPRGSRTAARSVPSRSRSGCSAAPSPGAGRGGRTPGRRWPRTSSPTRSASCGCSTVRTRCWLMRGRPAVTRRWPTRSATTPAGSGCSSGGPRRRDIPRAAGRGGRRLPGGVAGAVREPADAPPAGSDCGRRVPEAAGVHPTGAARRAGRRTAAAGRRPGAGRLGSATCAGSVHLSTTSEPSRWWPLTTGPLPEAVPRVLDALGADLGVDDALRAAVPADTAA
jgi:hypothetical protein